jgi:uncharacterized phage protein (TIGR02220 family)
MKNRDMAEIQPYRLLHPMLVRKAGPTAAVLFGELVNHATFHADGDGWFWLTQERITELLGIGEKATVNALEKLQQLDLLMIDTRGDKNRRHFRLVATTEAYLAAIADGQFLPNDGTSSAKRTEPVPAKGGNEFPPKDGTSFFQTEEQVPAKGGHYEKVIEEKVIEEKVIEEKVIEEKEVARKKTDDETGLTVAPQKQKKTVSKKEKSRGLTSFHDAAGRLIDHLNAVAGSRFRHVAVNLDAFARVLHAAEGTEEEVRWVIEFKTMQWKDKPDMSHNLNPQTLCRALNFPRYLEQMHSARHQVERGTYGKTQQEIATEQAIYQVAVNFVPPHLRKY